MVCGVVWCVGGWVRERERDRELKRKRERERVARAQARARVCEKLLGVFELNPRIKRHIVQYPFLYAHESERVAI